MNTLNKEQPNLRCEYDNKEVMEEVRYSGAPAFLKNQYTGKSISGITFVSREKDVAHSGD